MKPKKELHFGVEFNFYQLRTKKFEEHLRIIQLSDLHFGKYLKKDAIFQKISVLNPDLILLTGDYFYSKKEFLQSNKKLKELFSKLNAKYGVFASFGNADLWIEKDWFENTNITLLRNFSEEITTNQGKKIKIIGIDFNHSDLKYDDELKATKVRRLLQEINQNNYCIFLHHTPDLVEDLSPLKKIDLYLAGHTHGGQIRVPFLRLFRKGQKEFPYSGALITFSKFGIKYESGPYLVDDTFMYVNRGIGVHGPKIRLFCAPEVAIFDIN